MGFLRYTSDELRPRLHRAVSWRWPNERLLLVVPCEVERIDPRADWSHRLGGPSLSAHPHSVPRQLPGRREAALLGVTGGRLVYEQASRRAVLARVAAVFFGVVALVSLISGVLGGFFFGVLTAALFWVAGRVVEVAAAGSSYLEFAQIEQYDVDRQEFRGTGKWGVRHRIRVEDPEDFGFLLRLLYQSPGFTMEA